MCTKYVYVNVYVGTYTQYFFPRHDNDNSMARGSHLCNSFLVHSGGKTDLL